MIEQATKAFVLEARELLADLEDLFLALESDVTAARIDEIFRALHTVKGSGSMFGYTALSRFTHHFENAYDLVRSGELQVERNLIDLSLLARDLMLLFLELGGDGAEAEALLVSAKATDIINNLSGLTGNAADPAAQINETSRPENKTDQSMRSGTVGMQHFHIRFCPEHEALRNGMRPDLLMRELSDLGKMTVTLDVSAVPRLSELDPTDGLLGWVVEIETGEGREAVEDVFIFADDADLSIAEVPAEPNTAIKETSAVAAVPPTTPKNWATI